MNSIGTTLKELRLSKNLSVEDVVAMLKERNIVISTKTLYGYENDIPLRSSTFLALCEIYSVTDIFSTFLKSIPKAKFEWEEDYYEDYFGGRTVNEKFLVLKDCGIPSFIGHEKECSSDVFFGSAPKNVKLTKTQSEIINELNFYSEEQQKAFLALLKTFPNNK